MNSFSHFSGKKVLITGGLGFIGSNLAATLVGLGAQVTIVDNLIPEYGGLLFNVHDIKDKIEIQIADVRSPESMKALVPGKDYLFNLAGQTSHMDSMSDPYTDLDINCKAQLTILDACRLFNPAIKIVFASTRQIYGKPEYLPVDEKHLLRPVDVNGINKMAGEWYHILFNNVYAIRTCSLRLTNTYGPRMRIKDARQTFVGVWIRYLMEGKRLSVWDGSQLRDFSFVDDVIEAFLFCALDEKANGKIYNLGGEPIVSLKELAELLLDINGDGQYDVMPFPDDRKKIDVGDYYSDFGLIQREIGWKPQTTLRAGLKKTLEFYKHHLKNYL